MHGPEETLEHAAHGEPVEHVAHTSFERKVAMTMVIVAAVLAAVKVVGHRAHNDTLRYEIETGKLHTQESDQWAFYQAKKQRQYLFESEAAMLAVLAKDAGNAQAASQAEALIAKWKEDSERYKKETGEIEKTARQLQEDAKIAQAKAEESHHKSDRYDLGELGVELALVLCSVAVLTKRGPFWYGGIVVGLIGAAVGISGLFVH